MKRTIALFLVLAFSIAGLAAVESAPSDVVGFIKHTVPAGQTEAVALAFDYKDADSNTFISVNEAFFGTFPLNTKVTDLISATNVNKVPFGTGWVGSLTNLAYNHAFSVYNPGATELVFYQAGKVNNSAQTYDLSANQYTWIGLNDVRTVALADLGLPAGLPLNSKITEAGIGNGNNANKVPFGTGWVGSLTGFRPGVAYILNTPSATTGVTWNYAPAARALSIDLNNSFKSSTKTVSKRSN